METTSNELQPLTKKVNGGTITIWRPDPKTKTAKEARNSLLNVMFEVEQRNRLKEAR